MDKLALLFRSRKFYAALIGLIVVFVGDRAGIAPDALLNAVVVLVGYIVGTAIEDNSARG
jgi:hypothetical protein